MTVPSRGPVTAHSRLSDSASAAAELVAQLAGTAPRCIIFFAGIAHDGGVIGERLLAAHPDALVLGCSSNGEFSNHGYGKDGVVALSLGSDKVGRAALALAELDGGIDSGIKKAAATLGERLGTPLRELSPERYIGIALLEGAKGQEERINEALGNVAPILPFVGGSAGDNIRFDRTWVFADGKLSYNGCAMLCLELLVPFVVLKTCNFVATDTEITITKADVERRLILEIDGQPAARRYAELVGVPETALGFATFLDNPLGLMVDDEPWLRSGVRPEGDALFFACSVVPGMRLNRMRATDLVEDARAALARASAVLGGPPSAGILFNCAYRMLEAQIKGSEAAYHQLLSGFTHAGLHSNGESYLGHINQTLTGLLIA